MPYNFNGCHGAKGNIHVKANMPPNPSLSLFFRARLIVRLAKQFTMHEKRKVAFFAGRREYNHFLRAHVQFICCRLLCAQYNPTENIVAIEAEKILISLQPSPIINFSKSLLRWL